MNLKEAAKLINTIAIQYPAIIPENDTGSVKLKAKVKLWQMCLADVDYTQAEKAMIIAMRKSHFALQPADILEAIDEIKGIRIPTPEQAWQEVIYKMRRCNFEPVIYSHPAIKQAVMQIGASQIANSNTDDTYMMHYFCGVYKSLLARRRIEKEVKAVSGGADIKELPESIGGTIKKIGKKI